MIPWSGTAVAHGSVFDPASRNYGCWLRWGNDFQNPAMAQQDPMCWQAWRDNPNAMWNWNGLYRNGPAGNFQAVVPDGQLCNGGHTEGGRYNSLDTLVARTGRYAPSQNYSIPVSTSGFSGRHVVYTIWQAAHTESG